MDVCAYTAHFPSVGRAGVGMRPAKEASVPLGWFTAPPLPAGSASPFEAPRGEDRARLAPPPQRGHCLLGVSGRVSGSASRSASRSPAWSSQH